MDCKMRTSELVLLICTNLFDIVRILSIHRVSLAISETMLFICRYLWIFFRFLFFILPSINRYQKEIEISNLSSFFFI